MESTQSSCSLPQNPPTSSLNPPSLTPPPNHLKRWTSAEEEQLLMEVQREINMEQIAKNHGRKPGAIKTRLELIAAKLHHQGQSDEEVKRVTLLNDEELRLAISRNNYHLIRKTPPSKLTRSQRTRTVPTRLSDEEPKLPGRPTFHGKVPMREKWEGYLKVAEQLEEILKILKHAISEIMRTDALMDLE